MKTSTVTWIATFTAALAIVAVTSGIGPRLTPNCIDCFQQPCCTNQFCPNCSANCGASDESLSYTVLVAGPGDWLPIAADPQLCYTIYPCVAMPIECEGGWFCLADYFSPTDFTIPGCAVGSPCPNPNPDPDPVAT